MTESQKTELAHKLVDNFIDIAEEFVKGLNGAIIDRDRKMMVVDHISKLRSNLHVAISE